MIDYSVIWYVDYMFDEVNIGVFWVFEYNDIIVFWGIGFNKFVMENWIF